MDLRDRILRAAARVFSEEGFRGATTRRIASEAGVNEITLFRHFGSKERLLMEACVAAEEGAERPTLPEVPRQPRRELRGWARQILARLRSRSAFIRACMAEGQTRPEMVPPRSQSVEATCALRDYLVRLRRSKLATASFDPGIAASMLMGVLFSDAVARDVMPDLFDSEPDRAVEHYVDLFLRGIGVRPTAARKVREALP